MTYHVMKPIQEKAAVDAKTAAGIAAQAEQDVSRFLHDMEYFTEQTRPGTWQMRALKEELTSEIEAVRADHRAERLKWALMRFDSYLTGIQPQEEDLLELQRRLRGHSFNMRMKMQKRRPVTPAKVNRLFAA